MQTVCWFYCCLRHSNLRVGKIPRSWRWFGERRFNWHTCYLGLVNLFLCYTLLKYGSQSHSHTVYLLLLVTATALLLSIAYLILTRMFTRAIMHITLVLSIILNMWFNFPFHTVSTLWQIMLQRYLRLLLDYQILLYVVPSFLLLIILRWRLDTAGAIIFTIIALFSFLSYFGFRSRIPLASLLLQVIMDISKHHTSVYAVAFSFLVLQATLSV